MVVTKPWFAQSFKAQEKTVRAGMVVDGDEAGAEFIKMTFREHFMSGNRKNGEMRVKERTQLPEIKTWMTCAKLRAKLPCAWVGLCVQVFDER